jgi:hypothetical protein
MRRLVATVLAAALLAGCVSGGIPRDQAIRIALEHSFSAGLVDSANDGPLDQFLNHAKIPDVPGSLHVWAIRIRGGRTPGDCVAEPNGALACDADAPNVFVILDAQTGEVIFAENEGP